MIEPAIRALLLADATVVGLVGQRVYKDELPQNPTMPAVVVKKIDKVSDLTQNDAVGPNRVRVQVDCWAGDRSGVSGADVVRSVAEAVNGADDQSTSGPLHHYAGQSEGLHIKLLELAVERATEYEPDTKLHRISADYRAHL